jgi:plastocyanin
VRFPAQGNFKFTCLIHASMNGTVHVLGAAATLPYSQQAYNLQALTQVASITGDLVPFGLVANGFNRVFTVGKVVATGGGWQYGSLFRFVDPLGRIITKSNPLVVRLGQTVEFTNIDPAEPHTITFGCPTDDATCPVGGGPGALVDTNGSSGTAGDGGRFAVMNGPFDPADETNRDAGSVDEINSGLIAPGAQDRATGVSPLSGTPGTTVPLAQVSPVLNRFRVTFNTPGMYRWICELHDEIGMVGWVKVVP